MDEYVDDDERLLRRGDEEHAVCVHELSDTLERKRDDPKSLFSPRSKSHRLKFDFISESPVTPSDEARCAEELHR